MAGLLAGRRAATHWAFYDVLKALGAVPVEERVVVDGDRFTGGGITAGIDFGLRLLAELRGEEIAKVTQLMLEYDPDPPFDAGHPRTAAPEIVAAARMIVSDAMVAEGLAIAAGRRSGRCPCRAASPWARPRVMRGRRRDRVVVAHAIPPREGGL